MYFFSEDYDTAEVALYPGVHSAISNYLTCLISNLQFYSNRKHSYYNMLVKKAYITFVA
jgi:hypothetical protein